MDYKKILSLLLVASMAISMPINVFAAQPVTETENQTEVEPYIADVTAPILTGITLNSDTVKAGETLTVTIDATEEESGLGYCDATFVNKKTKKRLTASSDNYQNPTTLSLKISEYEPNGVYELVSVQLGDKAGNYVLYDKEPIGEPVDNTEIEQLTFDRSFTVTNENQTDSQAPKLTNIEISHDTVKAGETLTVTIDATEEESGIDYCDATFVNPKTKKRLDAWAKDYRNPTVLTLKVSEYEPSGVYELVSVQLGDKAGNYVLYDKEPIGEPVDNTEIEQLTFNLSFTVINDDNIPTPTPDPTPSNPDKGTSSNSSSSSSSAVNYESEKPNPADKKAVEAYNFWQDAKAKVRTTPDGKTMRLFVPKDITYMPASMMETLYREKITLIITHNGKKIVIPAGKAMPKQKLKVYWTFESLEKLYQA